VKHALPVRRLAEPHQARRAVHVPLLKLCRRQMNMVRNPGQIFFRKIDLSLHLTASRTTRLTLEAETVRLYFASVRLTPVVMIRLFLVVPGSGLLM
jgi:hypothetical protein